MPLSKAVSDREFYVYVLLNPLKKGPFIYNYESCRFEYEPFYVGLSCTKQRLNSHFNDCNNPHIKSHNPHKDNTIRKIQKQTKKNPPFVIFLDKLSMKDACKIEIDLISILGKRLDGGILTNITDGGEGLTGYIFPQEVIDRRVATYKFRFDNEPDFRDRILDARRNQIFTSERRNLISQNSKCWWANPKNKEQIKKVLQQMKERSQSEEGRLCSSIGRKSGWDDPNKKEQNQNIINQLTKSKRNSYKLWSPDGEYFFTDNLEEWCIERPGMNCKSIQMGARRRGSYKGWKVEVILSSRSKKMSQNHPKAKLKTIQHIDGTIFETTNMTDFCVTYKLDEGSLYIHSKQNKFFKNFKIM